MKEFGGGGGVLFMNADDLHRAEGVFQDTGLFSLVEEICL